MKYVISLFVIFTMAIRPLLPLLNYAVNYDYILNLCEKKNIPQTDCKGKCYVAKDFAKTEKQNSSQTVKITVADVFISGEILSYTQEINPDFPVRKFYSEFTDYYASGYFPGVFHPPLVSL